MTSGEACAPAHRPIRCRCPLSHQSGFGYLMVLFATAAIGITLASAGEVWRTAALREKEAQLLFVGHQFRLALASYRDRSPAGSPDAPVTLDDLLMDKRFPTPVPHLRRLWRDPMTNTTDWALVKPAGRITGIHTRHGGQPLRTAHEQRDAALMGTTAYSQWVFEAEPEPAGPGPSPAATQAQPRQNAAQGTP